MRASCVGTATALIAAYIASMLVSCSATGRPLAPPSLDHVLGTDPIGRDALCVLLAGLASTLVAALLSALVVALIGVLAALLPVQHARIASKSMVILPRIALIALIAQLAMLDSRLVGVLVGAFFATEAYAPLAAEARRVWNSAVVEAAVALGAGRVRIALRYVIPEISASIVRYSSLAAATAIVALAGLSMTGVIPATQVTIGTLAFLVLTTPGALYTPAGQAQIAAVAVTVVATSYAMHHLGMCLSRASDARG